MKSENLLHLQKRFEVKYIEDKKYLIVRDYCNYTGKYKYTALRICNLKYSVPKEIVFLQWIKLWLSVYHKRASKRV